MTAQITDLVDQLYAVRQRFDEEPKEIWSVDDAFMDRIKLDKNKAHCMTYGGVRRLVVHKDVIEKIAKLASVEASTLTGQISKFQGLPILNISSPPLPHKPDSN